MALAVAAVAVSAGAGCSATRAGAPRAANPAPVSAAAPASDTPPLPQPRPRSLDLVNVSPCRLLTEAQLASFKVDQLPVLGTLGGAGLLSGSPDCNFGSDAEQRVFLVVLSTAVGLPEFVDSIAPSPSGRDIEVEHYPAVQAEGAVSAPESGNGVCFVHVDVADGQLLSVQSSQVSALPGRRLPIETLCALGRAVAAAAVTTLRGG